MPHQCIASSGYSSLLRNVTPRFIHLPLDCFFRLLGCNCCLQRQARPGRHLAGRLHGFIGRAVKAKAPSLAFGLVGEAPAPCRFKYGACVRSALEPQRLALTEVGQQCQREPAGADAVATKYAPRRAGTDYRQEFAAVLGKLVRVCDHSKSLTFQQRTLLLQSPDRLLQTDSSCKNF